MNLSRFSVLLLVGLLAGACQAPQTVEGQLSQARQFKQKGDLKSAAIILKDILQKNPRSGEARYLLGLVFMQNHEPQWAERHLREALDAKYDPQIVLPALARSLFEQAAFEKLLEATHSSDYGEAALQPEILSLRGHSQVSLGRPDAAAKSFEEALKRRPEYAPALLGQLRLASAKGQLPVVTKLVDRALAADPSSLDAWLMKGDLDRANGKADAALAAYQKALSLNPAGLAANLNLASAYMADGKLDLARKHVDAILRIAPNSAVGYYLLGLLTFRSKDFAAANTAVRQVLKAAPNYLPATVLSGMIASSLGAYEQAEKLLGEAFSRSPDSIQLRRLYAATLLRSRKAQQAIEILEPALRAAPNDPGLLALFAEAKFQGNDIPAARKYFDRAVKQNPNDPRIRTGLGLARLAAGDTEKALADLEAAVELGGSAADSFLVTSLMSVKQYDKALEAVARLEAKRPKDPLTFNLKGAVLFAKRDIAGARKAFERAGELQPARFAAAMNLAQLDRSENNPAEARKRFEEIVARDQGNTTAMLALADLAAVANNRDAAIMWAGRARQAQPNAFAPSMALARLYFAKSDYANAMAAADAALRANPDHAEALNILGYCQLRLGKNLEALNTYTVLASRYPTSAEARYGLGNAQAANNKLAAAQLSLKKAIGLRADFVEAIYALAALQLRMGKIAEVGKLVADAQKRLPKSALGFVIAGDAATAEKRYGQAVQAYEAAFAMDRTQTVLMRLHGALRSAGKTAAAEALTEAWLKKNPNDLQIRYLAANTAIGNGNFRLAAEQFRYALEREPKKLALLHNLSWVYERLNDPRALEVAETAYKIAPDDPGVLHDLGRLLVDKGDAARAVDLLEKARLLAPDSQLVRYHLARAYAKSGANPRARAELEQLLRSPLEFAERADAAKLLKQLKK